MISGIKEKIDHFDPYNVLAIATKYIATCDWFCGPGSNTYKIKRKMTDLKHYFFLTTEFCLHKHTQ